MRKRYNTPHRSRVVKTRMTEEEYAEFAERLSAYNMSQAEFIRQAITGAAIRWKSTVCVQTEHRTLAVFCMRRHTVQHGQWATTKLLLTFWTRKMEHP